MSFDESDPMERLGELAEEHQHALDDGDFEKAAEAIEDIFATAMDWCEKNPTPDFDLTVTAVEAEERADWDAAESAYRQILCLPDLEPSDEFKAHSDLAGLCRLLHRDADALDHTRRATAAARRADCPILLIMALRGESRYLIKCGRITEARKVIAEAISAIGDDEMYNQLRASMLTMRAECAIHDDASAEAERDLEDAYNLLEPLAGMDIAAGIQTDRSRWFSVAARLCAKCDDHNGSVTAWQKAVDISKHVASLPHTETVHARFAVAERLKGLADALLHCGLAEEAAAALAERGEILDRAGVPETGAEPR